MSQFIKEKLQKLLIGSKLIKESDFKKALGVQKKKGGGLGKILVAQGSITERDLLIILSRELNVPPIDLSKYKIDPKVAQLVPEKIAKQYELVPLSKMGNRLTVAMTDPLNLFAIDDIKTLTGYDIDMVLATESDIKAALSNIYGTTIAEVTKLIDESKKGADVEMVEAADIDIGNLAEESKKAPIVKVVDLILTEAIKRRASDIHIEPGEDSLRIRYRIDGNLQEVLNLPKKNQNAVLARLKIMSRLDITENRIPQDGRFKIRLEEKEIDFRVSVLPVGFGGKVVLRALDKANLSIGLDKLGFLPGPLETFREAIKNPYGMILVTGPTGSGKSTTLYSILNQLNTPKVNIITIEDPVEYQVEGITQIQANHDIGLTFSSGLRSLLRQSPDIVMIGEIRDSETADIAVKASLTGELVFSTLHTNDAAGAITRLVDMGVEPFLIASSLVLTVAQRLCRKICPACKVPVNIPEAVLKNAGIPLSDLSRKKGGKVVFYKGKGCKKCDHTGYHGRMGTLETLLIDDKIRDLIIQKKTSDEIKQYAVSKGMKTLRDNALFKLASGLTTLEEVLRIASE